MARRAGGARSLTRSSRRVLAAGGRAALRPRGRGTPDELSRRERRSRRACARTAAAKPTWERNVEMLMKDRASS